MKGTAEGQKGRLKGGARRKIRLSLFVSGAYEFLHCSFVSSVERRRKGVGESFTSALRNDKINKQVNKQRKDVTTAFAVIVFFFV